MFENSENILFINLKYLIIYKYRNLFRQRTSVDLVEIEKKREYLFIELLKSVIL